MENIKVRSESDSTLVIAIPELLLNKVWNKRGQVNLIDRDVLIQAFYNLAVETMFKEGMLVTEDKKFLQEVGLIDEEHPEIFVVTNDLLARMTKLMSLEDFKNTLAKFSKQQIKDYCDYAITHSGDFNLSKLEILSKAGHCNLNNMITNYKASLEV